MVKNPSFPNEGSDRKGFIVDHKEEKGRLYYKVWLAEWGGNNIDINNLEWIHAENVPSMTGSGMSGGAMDKGQLVSVRQAAGEGGTSRFTITGLLNNKEFPNLVLGNTKILAGLGKATQTAKDQPRKKNVKQPPDLKETVENGVKVIKAIEKGDWKFSLTKNFVNSVTIAPIFGNKVPQLKNMSTAMDAFEGILTGSMLSGLPGQVLSISSLFKNMPQALKNELSRVVPKEIIDTAESVISLAPSYEVSNHGGGASSGTRINPEVFYVHMIAKLKDAKNVEDVVAVILELMNDPQYHGMDKLPNTEIEVESAFGKVKQIIDSNGNISLQIPEAVQKAINLLSGGLAGIDILPSIQQKLGGMLMRFPPEARSKFKENFQAITQKAEVNDKSKLSNFLKGTM